MILEKYGFMLGRKPVTTEEIEGFKRWQRDREAEYRERHHDRITECNREYRRRRRAEALAEAQAKWTPAQWAAWNKKQEKKERGTPAWPRHARLARTRSRQVSRGRAQSSGGRRDGLDH